MEESACKEGWNRWKDCWKDKKGVQNTKEENKYITERKS